MSDSEDKPSAPGVPSWQRGESDTTSKSDESRPSDADVTDELEVARRFLEDDQVKGASREKKVEFLQAKGIADGDIDRLLRPAAKSSESEPQASTTSASASFPDTNSASPASSPSSFPSSPPSDRAPIVTYPEFLTKPTRPPPLVTSTALLNTLYAFAGASTLLYGISRSVIAPMVERLTDSRTELHSATAERLEKLTGRLEQIVSVVPEAAKADRNAEDDTDDDDPSELFHRDIGTQTTPFPDSPSGLSPKGEPASATQAASLATLTTSLNEIRDGLRDQISALEDSKTLVNVLREDLDVLTYGGTSGTYDFGGGYDALGSGKRSEPDDEIRRVKDSIRRVKGVLLSTRSFPASTR